jgi:hypothetical protein
MQYLSFGPREELDCNGGDDLPRMADSMSLGLAGLRALLGDSSTVSGVPVERPPPDGVRCEMAQQQHCSIARVVSLLYPCHLQPRLAAPPHE